MPTDAEYRVAFITARRLRDLEADPVALPRDYWRQARIGVTGP